MIKGLQTEWGTCSRTVSFNCMTPALACQKGIIAVGLQYGNIIILDAITGSQVSVLSEHLSQVVSLALSLDGTFLVSGGKDKAVKLWDIQIGGVIKTFCGHTGSVQSVSISPDCVTIASGSRDNTICLWNVRTGECGCVIRGHNSIVNSLNFSPKNSQLLISASDDHTVQWWNTDGHQIGPAYEGDYVALSSDGFYCVSWRRTVAMVQHAHSGAVVVSLQMPNGQFDCCCFSPDNKFVAGGSNCTIYVWDITSSDTCLIRTFTGHASTITSLAFPSSLISLSRGGFIKFWEISASSTAPVTMDSESTPLTSAPIKSVSLQANSNIAVSSDSIGVVRVWNISTGLCEASFHTPAKYFNSGDAQLIDGRLIFVWYVGGKISVWDTGRGELLQTVDVFNSQVSGLRISGDGSKVVFLNNKSIQAWSIWTGEAVGGVSFEDGSLPTFFMMDGSRAWVCFEDSQTYGWDFGAIDFSPIPLSVTPPNRPRLGFIDGTMEWPASLPRIRDTVTGAEVFQLCGRYARPTRTWWDGRYLAAGYNSGEVLILDLIQMIPQ